MPSPRRVRLLVLAAVVLTVFYFFYSSGLEGKQQHNLQDFYHKTMNAMDGVGKAPGQAILDTQTGAKAGQIPADRDGDGDIDADDQKSAVEIQERLKAAEQKAKDNANEKGGLRPDLPSKVVGVGSSAEGQKKTDGDSVAAGSDADAPLAREELAVETELNAILKKSPGKQASSKPVHGHDARLLTNTPQSSSFPSRTALTRSAPRDFSWRSTPSRPTRTSWSSTSTRLGRRCRTTC
jgi:hypothetical protein